MPILNWLNKDKATQTAATCAYRLLTEVPELSCGDKSSGNLIVQGDNLEALKALIPHYAGQVKCIFIDPPYNTGNAFEHYDDNLEHSLWLSLIYPRLELLRELLAEDGSIWVTIDDEEAHYLKVIMDEIFGRKNFVANAVWQKKYSPQNDARWLSDNHDHILVYAKNKEDWRPYLLPRTKEMNKKYQNPDHDPRGVWLSDNLSVKTYSEKTDYPITTPSGRIINPPEGRCWGYSNDKLEELIKDNRIWFGKDGKNVPRIKRFLSEVKQGTVSKTIWLREEVGDNQDSKREVRNFNNENVFSTPKPEKLLERIITLATNPNDLILDSFLGSGTTAAVAHKMGRRYIGVEIGEHAVTHCVPRLQAVIDGEQGGISKAVGWQGGGGFRFCRLGSAVFDGDGNISRDIGFAQLAAHIWYLETKQPLAGTANSPLLGEFGGRVYYLLFNGILGDRRPNGGNVLTQKILQHLPDFERHQQQGKQIIIYGESCRLGTTRLQALNITFKQIPYDIGSR